MTEQSKTMEEIGEVEYPSLEFVVHDYLLFRDLLWDGEIDKTKLKEMLDTTFPENKIFDTMADNEMTMPIREFSPEDPKKIPYEELSQTMKTFKRLWQDRKELTKWLRSFCNEELPGESDERCRQQLSKLLNREWCFEIVFEETCKVLRKHFKVRPRRSRRRTRQRIGKF